MCTAASVSQCCDEKHFLLQKSQNATKQMSIVRLCLCSPTHTLPYWHKKMAKFFRSFKVRVTPRFTDSDVFSKAPHASIQCLNACKFMAVSHLASRDKLEYVVHSFRVRMSGCVCRFRVLLPRRGLKI